MDANILAVFRKNWRYYYPRPLYYILHNHLSAAMQWRTRNPLMRWFDFLGVFNRPLPPNQYLMCLELGLGKIIEIEFPCHRGRVFTLEHPVLESEWAAPTSPNRNGPLKIGFVGHCSIGKGFDFFVGLADRFHGSSFEFHAIGRLNPPLAEMNMSSLHRKPHPDGLPRSDFLAALREMDMVCLPLRPDNKYVASGSLIDAFAACKPVLIIRNPMIDAIQEKYGSIGRSVSSKEDLSKCLDDLDVGEFLNEYDSWVKNLRRLRESRRSDKLANYLKTNIE